MGISTHLSFAIDFPRIPAKQDRDPPERGPDQGYLYSRRIDLLVPVTRHGHHRRPRE
jgi:hypothetical protein